MGKSGERKKLGFMEVGELEKQRIGEFSASPILWIESFYKRFNLGRRNGAARIVHQLFPFVQKIKRTLGVVQIRKPRHLAANIE